MFCREKKTFCVGLKAQVIWIRVARGAYMQKLVIQLLKFGLHIECTYPAILVETSMESTGVLQMCDPHFESWT